MHTATPFATASVSLAAHGVRSIGIGDIAALCNDPLLHMQCLLFSVRECIGITIYWWLWLRLASVIRHAMEIDMVVYCWTGVFSSWIHATQISSLCCGYDCSCRLARPWILWVRMIEVASFMTRPLKPRPTTMSTVIILCFICMTHDSSTHITFWIELWISSFSSWSTTWLRRRERHTNVFFCSNIKMCEVRVLTLHVARLVLELEERAVPHVE